MGKTIYEDLADEMMALRAERDALLAKLDREKLAILLSDTAPWAASMDEFDHWAGAIIRYLKEG